MFLEAGSHFEVHTNVDRDLADGYELLTRKRSEKLCDLVCARDSVDVVRTRLNNEEDVTLRIFK